jgi:hypothetical protein
MMRIMGILSGKGAGSVQNGWPEQESGIGDGRGHAKTHCAVGVVGRVRNHHGRMKYLEQDEYKPQPGRTQAKKELTKITVVLHGHLGHLGCLGEAQGARRGKQQPVPAIDESGWIVHTGEW